NLMKDASVVLTKEATTDLGRIFFQTILFQDYCDYANTACIEFMKRFSDDYEEGFWRYYKVGQNSGFMCPDTDNFYYFELSNYFSGKVSSEAAGIIVTLYIFQACFDDAYKNKDSELCDHFREAINTLKDYAATIDESGSIFRAID
ncbi:antirestriction protein, partial [Escherichia coli]